MSETLFTRLAAYSQNPAKKSLENFTTEVLAYLIGSDRTFREIFLGHVIRNKRLLRHFRRASAQPQQSFGNGIVDLVLSATGRQILIEVKIAAPETNTKIYGRGRVSQIKKYLSYRCGHVAYLTTKSVSAPDAKSKSFLGHFFFEDLFEKLKERAQSLTTPGKLFLDFMRENEMHSLEPFSQREIKFAEDAFSFAKKCEYFLNEIKAQVEPAFRRIFHTRSRFTGGHFSPTYGSSYIYPTRFKRGNTKALYIWIEAEDGGLFYGVAVNVTRADLKKLNRHLKWFVEQGQLFSSRPMRAGVKPGVYVKPILRDLKKLKGALNRVY